MNTWRDYLEECEATSVDLQLSSNAFPKNLRESHQRQIERKKAIADEKLNKQIQKQVTKLERFSFEYNGFLIRPAVSAQELANESNKLIHCVSGYGERYAKGETAIFVLRKVDAADEPFYTVEIKKRQIMQVRGLKNCPPTKQVDAFMKMYAATVLVGKKPVAV